MVLFKLFWCDGLETCSLTMSCKNYKFVAADMGSYGKEGDSGRFLKSAIGKKVSWKFKVPSYNKLHWSDIVLPNVLVADNVAKYV